MKIVNLLALSTDIVIEKVFQEAFANTDVRVVTSRLEFENPLTEDNLKSLANKVENTILRSVNPDLVVFGCTSASILLGMQFFDKFDQRIISPLSCLLEQKQKDFFCVGAYTESLTESLMVNLKNMGLNVDHTSLGYDNDMDIAKIEYTDILQNTNFKSQQNIDFSNILFMCTALDITKNLKLLEEKTGKKCFTSNQLLISWIKENYGIQT